MAPLTHRDLRGGPAFVAAFGPMVVINLAYRTDRLHEFEDQLKRVGLSLGGHNIRVFPAVRPQGTAGFPTVGARGAFLSHLGILRAAVAEGLETLVVCEDDLDFARNFNERVAALLPTLQKQPWDILYAGHDPSPRGEPLYLGGQILTVAPEDAVRCLHFILLRGPVIGELVHYLEAILERARGHPEGGPMHVDGALSRFRKDHPQYVTLALVPPLGHQRSSRTDIHDLRWFDRTPGLRQIVQGLRWLKRALPH